ncbi:MAG TPA: NAD(P)(+) transhydrogenase (Re/Si-specific) subunit alpha, partial [Bacteroidota bacterium]|nr:NAD(P)(+) transhydrogenase (Re/Si-specific) subunit alpha [Bacteroidota bacterium]
MKIAVPKEQAPGETRVALTPASVKQVLRDGHEVAVEAGAGEAASIPDKQFVAAGAKIVRQSAELYAAGEVIFKVQAPIQQDGIDEAGLIRNGGVYVG